MGSPWWPKLRTTIRCGSTGADRDCKKAKICFLIFMATILTMSSPTLWESLLSHVLAFRGMLPTDSLWIWRQKGIPGSPLLNLPVELLLFIISNLDYSSKVTLKLSCKQLYAIIPMPEQLPSHREQRLALLRLIPPPRRRNRSPVMLCEDCLKYHSPNWPVSTIETSSGACMGTPQQGKTQMLVKPCKLCWAFGEKDGLDLKCACGKQLYTLWGWSEDIWLWKWKQASIQPCRTCGELGQKLESVMWCMCGRQQYIRHNVGTSDGKVEYQWIQEKIC